MRTPRAAARARKRLLSMSSRRPLRSPIRAGQRSDPSALAQPGVRRKLARDLEQRVAHLRKQLHMLVAVDEIGRAAEGVDEHPHLARDLARERRAVEPMQSGAREHRAERQERAVPERREILAQRPERRGQRQMQSDRRALRRLLFRRLSATASER